MAVTKRIDGNYIIEPVPTQPSADNLTIRYTNVIFDNGDADTGLVTIDGDLTVIGEANFTERNDVIISDTIITLNAGEIADGVATPFVSGIEIDRGTLPDSKLLWREDLTAPYSPWFVIDDGSGTERNIVTSSLSIGADDSGPPLWHVVEDTTPQLGGDLDVNGQSFVSVTNGDIVFTANGTGDVVLNSPLNIKGSAPGDAPVTGEVKVYTGADGGGGTQIHFQNDTDTGELVSKSKAIVFSLIF